jgi:hypothetical protein
MKKFPRLRQVLGEELTNAQDCLAKTLGSRFATGKHPRRKGQEDRSPHGTTACLCRRPAPFQDMPCAPKIHTQVTTPGTWRDSA